MIVRELLRVNEDGTELYKTYSDTNKYILQVETGIEYSEAIDIDSTTYTYIETDKEIEPDEVDK